MEEELQKLNYEANEEDVMGGGDQCCYTRQAITPPSRPMTGVCLFCVNRIKMIFVLSFLKVLSFTLHLQLF